MKKASKAFLILLLLLLLLWPTGVAVMTVMTVTTCLLALVMLVTWNAHPLLVLLFLAVYLPLEGAFLSATLVKVSSGGEAR
jgi:KUP system potassium uptake protein